MNEAAWRKPAVQGWLALCAVYVFWGSTYLAIRVGVQHFPPLLLAASRYLLPGAILYVATWKSARGRAAGGKEWMSAIMLGFLLLLGGNGGVTLGEQTLTSGIASLLVAAVPLWLVLMDAAHERRLVSPLVIAGLLIGWLGIALLVRPTAEQRVDLIGAGFVLAGGVLWAAGS
ncbi:MAG TPA: EamA family transporter, partial [Chloroflexota bacterium]|nr:EamA family transporter [Chloroflexota bacterium]